VASFGYAISFPFPLLQFYYIISPLLLSQQQYLLFTLHLPQPTGVFPVHLLANRYSATIQQTANATAIKYKELQGVPRNT
jgi:hypothetical protein